jgi:hypothetical protein
MRDAYFTRNHSSMDGRTPRHDTINSSDGMWTPERPLCTGEVSSSTFGDAAAAEPVSQRRGVCRSNGRTRHRASGYFSPPHDSVGWNYGAINHPTARDIAEQERRIGIPAPNAGAPRREMEEVASGFIVKGYDGPSDGALGPKTICVPAGFRRVPKKELPAKVNQFVPHATQQRPELSLDMPPQQKKVRRLPATPLILEVDERLKSQGLGSLLDVRHASDAAIAELLKASGFSPTERMTVLWELRRRHPHLDDVAL